MAKGSIDFGLIKRFIKSEFRPYKGLGAIAVAFMVLVAITTVLSTWILQVVIDDLFNQERTDLILPVAIGIIVIYLIKGGATYGYSVILSKISAGLAATMRRSVLAKLLRQDIPYFDQHETADIVNRITNVTKSAGDLIRVLLTSAMRDALTVIFLVAFMIYTDWKLTIFTFLIAPPVIWGVSFITKRIRSSVATEFTMTSHFMTLLYERLAGIRLIRSFSNEYETQEHFDQTIDNLQSRAVKIANTSALSSPLTEALGGVAVAGIISYAAYAIIAGYNTTGAIMAFILAFINAYEPIKRLANLRVNLVKQMVPLSYYYELVDQQPQQLFGDEDLSSQASEIEFKDVTFSYEEGASALNGVSFTVPAGKVTALVGRSGSGKSTLFSLLQRFYDLETGAINVDGKELGCLSKLALYGAIAAIPQETTIFTQSIADNIAIGSPDASREDIEKAAKAAHMEDFIKAMPNGFDTMLGEGNASLSGGQKQRLSVARAILKDAPILLLDEATSALDSESEAIVQKAIQSATSGKTVIVIAHRLSTIRDADQIVVMDQGKVVEIGTHTELLKKTDGIYTMLNKLQFKE